MKPRIQTKLRCLVSHAEPNGYSKIGERDRLMHQFNKGTISNTNLKRLVTFMLIEKKQCPPPLTITVSYGGRTLTLTIEEYERYKHVFIV